MKSSTIGKNKITEFEVTEIDWSKACPTEEEIKERFAGQEIEDISYDTKYPRVEVLVDNQIWAWDKFHGGGFWYTT